MISFFRNIWQTPNQLLRAVFQDICVPEYVAGCRALGLINKVVTGPLWRVLESADISILEMNGYYQTLVSSMHEWSQDASILLHGEAVLFPDFPPVQDPIWHSLITPSSSSDAITLEILQIMCHTFSNLLTRLLSDHLSGGKYDHSTPALQNETRSVPKTNTVSERDFAKLDRLLREKPNASTLALEAMVLFSNNKTAKWLQSKTKAEVAELMQKAREVAPEYKRLYNERRKKLQEERIQLLKAKQKELQKSQERSLHQKESLTKDIVQCGLWQSPDEIFHGLAKHKTKSAKVKALKAQINFRRKVLQQTHSDKDLFVFSKNRKPLSIEELISNLEKLLSESEQSEPRSEQETPMYQETLIGKRIRHRWCNEDGTEEWYNGKILSAVAGTTEWFNVAYDGEVDVLTLNLYEDIENGDLDIVS